MGWQAKGAISPWRAGACRPESGGDEVLGAACRFGDANLTQHVDRRPPGLGGGVERLVQQQHVGDLAAIVSPGFERDIGSWKIMAIVLTRSRASPPSRGD